MDVSDLYRVIEQTEGSDDAVAGKPATGTVVLSVHVQPGAGRSAVVGRHGAALKVRVAAAPEGGRANEATAAILAETFGVAASAVEVANGATSRSKQFRLSGVELEEFERLLERAAAANSPSRIGPKKAPK